MAKILITGNGYDLSKGLPTSYSDFINILNHIKKVEKFDFKDIYSLTSNKELLFKNYKEFQFDVIKIERLQSKLKDNFWYNFFAEEFDIETWIDFETKIEYLLKAIITGILNIEENILNVNNISIGTSRTFRSNAIFKSNNYDIIDILIKLNIIIGDIDSFIFTGQYIKKRKGYYTEIDKKEIAKYLINQLDIFKEIFSDYFRIFVFPLYENTIQNTNNDLSFSKINYHLTFNYTPTFEKLQKIADRTYFLHGRINNDKNNIVLGINDIFNEIAKFKEFIPFTKYFQKFYNKTYYEFIYKIIQSKGSKSFQFFLYGHSLDVNDKYYINEIFDFVLNPKFKLKKEIIIIYHDKKSEKQLLENILYIRGKEDIQKLKNSKRLVFLHKDDKLLQRKINEDIKIN